MSAGAMPAQQQPFIPSPAVAFGSTSSADPSASPSTSTSGPAPTPNGISSPASGPSFQQPSTLQNGMNGAGFSGQPVPYNQYQPQMQPYNQHPSSHQQQHQPYYARNQSGFRPPHHQNQTHHQHSHQHQHQPPSQYQHQPDPNSHPHPHTQQHPNTLPHQQHTPSFQHRYPDPPLQQGYNGWTGGGGPYYPSPNQPYPQMGGPGPATMQNQNGYGYGMDQYGRQGYGGGMYGGMQGFDGRVGPEAENQVAPIEGDSTQPMTQQIPNFQPGVPPADYPYPPPLPNASNQSPHPHSSSVPPAPNGSGPYQPPYFPPNHPYHMGSGLGMGYSPYAPAPNYGGYGFGDGFMPPPLPNGANLPPHSSNAAPLPIPQSNGPTRSLNPAAQGFKFVPSNPPPPPVSAPAPPIPAPPPPVLPSSGPSASVAPAPAPVFASIRRTSTPKGLPQALAKEQKFAPPVMVDGEKLKGIGGKRRDSEDEYVEPVTAPALAVGDLLGLSEGKPIPDEEISPLATTATPAIGEPSAAPAPIPIIDSTPAMSTSATTPTSPQSVKTPRGPTDNDVPSTTSQSAKAPTTSTGQWQFVGPAMSGFMSPPSNTSQPSLAQAMDTLSGKSTPASTNASRTVSSASQTRKTKPIMDGPIVFTSTRPIASEKGENTFKSAASLRAAGETSGWKKGKERAQRRRAVLAFGEGARAGRKGQEGGEGKKHMFGQIEQKDIEALEKEAVAEKAAAKAQSAIPTPSSAHVEKSVAEAQSTSTATPSIATSPAKASAPLADHTPTPTPPSAPTPAAARKPATWAALVGSRITTTAPSLASTSATPSASAAPSKLPSPSKPSATLPSTPEISNSDILESSSKLPATPASGPGPAAGKRPTFNYAAAAAAGAALSPADELVKLLSEGLGSRGLAPGVSKGTIPRGLINTGNMCFINTILQTLAYCPPFTDLLETLGQRLKADLGRKTPLLEAVIVFLRELQPSPATVPLPVNGANGTMTPRGMSRSNTGSTSFQNARGAGGKDAFVPENVYEAMKENKRFDSMRRGFQEDAEEYLGFFLNTLHEELLFLLSRTHTRSSPQPNGNGTASSDGREHSIERPVSPPAQADASSSWLEVGKKQRTHVVRSNESRESAITRIFGGTLRSILHTPGLKDSITLEPYQPLQLDISDPTTTRSVVDALRHLSTPEIVQTWSAAKKENVDATKTVFVETWPGVLICHLKRFVYDSEEREVVKKSRAVAYGTELIVPNEIISPTKRSSVPVKYRLFGVVYHHGSTASGGHYTVAVSRQDHQQWIHFDDETVQPVPTEQVIVSPEEAESGRAGLIGGREKCAYLLFYQRIRA